MNKYSIKEIKESAKWNVFLSAAGSPSFLQSWEWGEVQKRHGYRVERLGIYENGQILGIAETLYIRAKRGNMIFVPHGPVTKNGCSFIQKKDIVLSLREHLASQGRKDKFHFIRIAPIWEDSPEARSIFSTLDFRTSPIYMHAERVWMLDLTKREDELLKNMRKTTRYSIKKAEKEGVGIERETDLKRFWNIYKVTAERENFTPFSKDFIRYEYEEFHKTNRDLFISGILPDGKTCAASALIVFTESTAFYHQGATTHSKIPVSYLLQWYAIREAIKRGCRYYNFWGILQPGRTPKNWSGLSLFKQGFGGFSRDYVPTQDFVINPLRYAINYAYESYLKRKRGV